jgi:hypothetical protein
MVFRNIIKIIEDFLLNPVFRSNMQYKLYRLYTSASKTEQVYTDMVALDWWWREMVSQNYTRCPLIQYLPAL